MNAVVRVSGHFEGLQNLFFDLNCKHTNKSGLPYTIVEEKSFLFLAVLFFSQCVKHNESLLKKKAMPTDLTKHWLLLSAKEPGASTTAFVRTERNWLISLQFETQSLRLSAKLKYKTLWTPLKKSKCFPLARHCFFLIHLGHNKWIRFHSLGTADYIIALGISPSMESAQKMNTLALSGD